MSFWKRLLPGKQWRLLTGKVSGIPDSFEGMTQAVGLGACSWADPFPVARDGRCWVFIEEVIHHPKKGRLAVFELNADGSVGPMTVILERDYHLSYPNVFQHDREWWLVPESRANRTVDLYRCVEWPHRWEYEKSLMRDIEVVDATFWQRDGRWWLFGGTPATPGGNASGQLCLWSADSPISEDWTPHPANPIVADRACARPAGRIFEHKGMLIRPAQNCVKRYGYGVHLMAIEEWTDTTYRERLFQAYTPPTMPPGAIATHTFNQAAGYFWGDVALRTWPG
ncbi:glucosamine inositolphosphorylceramide transferase family protein [Cerasicoccus maritimus]|uniref:glucosamine inositolphosphorylceramide transferase family protein n=1 Tax=Cerasicoccus maritimus TaxID=490089 RepID=UPI002852B791|nr:hypothetical protein [Cerasicoccus maritimus]